MKRSFLSGLFALVMMMAGFGGTVTAQQDDQGTPDASPMAGHDHDDHGADLSMGAAYLTITNNGDDADRLVQVETDAADAVEVHDVEITDGVMEMSPLHEGLEIPAGETVTLEPGSYHVMLIGLTESLIAGEDYDLTLEFEHAGEITVSVPILRTEPKEDDEMAGPVEAGDLEIDSIWSRQAPKIEAGMATPMSSPEATPAQ